MSPAGYRSGFVTLLGRPNTGKSTLVNALVGRKVAIVTPHPQTTRTHLLGVVNLAAEQERPGAQVVLVDTPGVHRGRGKLDRQMFRAVKAGLEGRDLSLYLADVSRPFGAEDQLGLDLLKGQAAPAFLLLNKVDLLRQQEDILPIIAAYKDRLEFARTIPISGLKRLNLEALIGQIVESLPEGPAYFPQEQSTDQPEQFLMGEIIREQAMLVTREEVPHTLAVRLEGDEQRQQAIGPLRVLRAALYCERPGQKAILIGRGGETIRKIGIGARGQLEEMLGTRVYLELRVVVRAEWREDPRFLAGLDFRSST